MKTISEFLEATMMEIRLHPLSSRKSQYYLRCLREYFESVGLAGLGDVDEIRHFLFQKLDEGISPQTVNRYLNAILFFYHQVYGLPERIQVAPVSCVRSPL